MCTKGPPQAKKESTIRVRNFSEFIHGHRRSIDHNQSFEKGTLILDKFGYHRITGAPTGIESSTFGTVSFGHRKTDGQCRVKILFTSLAPCLYSIIIYLYRYLVCGLILIALSSTADHPIAYCDHNTLFTKLLTAFAETLQHAVRTRTATLGH